MICKLSSVALYCQITVIVMNWGFNCLKFLCVHKGLQDIFSTSNVRIKTCSKLSRLSKNVNNCQNCWNSQNCQNSQKLSKIVKMLVRSCFLITVIKCLKGHRSLGSLFNVKNKKWLSDSVTDSLSEWQGHLLSCQVTAKN